VFVRRRVIAATPQVSSVQGPSWSGSQGQCRASGCFRAWAARTSCGRTSQSDDRRDRARTCSLVFGVNVWTGRWSSV